MVNFVLAKMKSKAMDQLNGKSSGSSNKGRSSGGSGKVIELTDATFSMAKNTNKELYMMMFYAPWCGHCKNLKPKYEQAARNNSNPLIKFARINCDEHKTACGNYGIQGYPTLKVFLPGGRVEEYNGGRDESSLLSIAESYAKKLVPPKPLAFLENNDKFDEYCVKDSGICLIAFLPHIMDTGKEGRTKYRKTLEELYRKHQSKPIKFLWAQAGDQFGFEEKLNLGFGYPAVVAISFKKKMYGVMRDSFDSKGLDRFVTGLMSGHASLYKIQGELPKIKKAKIYEEVGEL
jgi:protein disulfide-isomerase A6